MNEENDVQGSGTSMNEQPLPPTPEQEISPQAQNDIQVEPTHRGSSLKHYIIIGFALLMLIVVGGYISLQILNNQSERTSEIPTPSPFISQKPTPASLNSYTHETEKYTFSYPDGTSIEDAGTELSREKIVLNNTIPVYYRDKIYNSCDNPGDCPFWDAQTTQKQIGDHIVTIVEHTAGGLGYTTLRLRSYYVPVPTQDTYLVFDAYAANLDVKGQTDPDGETLEKYTTIPEETILLVENVISTLTFDESTSSSNSFQNWVTVENPEFGYSIQYPAEKYDNCYVSGGNLRLFKKENPCPSVGDALYAIGVTGVPSSAPNFLSESSEPDSVKDIVVDGKPAQEKYYVYDWQDGPLEPLGSSTKVHIPTYNGRIEIEILGEDPEIMKDFRDMISTIQLFDQ